MALNACQDLPTAIPPTSQAAPTRAALTYSAGNHLGQVPYYCLQGRRSAEKGWQLRLDTLYFPQAEQDLGNRRVRVLYRQWNLQGTLLTAADCFVPYTEVALRRLDRHLGVKVNGAAEQFRTRQGMISVQGCVTDDHCWIDGMVIVAPPREEEPLPPCDACNYYPGGGGDGGGGSGGGGDTGSGVPPGEDGPGVFAACVAGMLGLAGSTAMLKPVTTEMYNKASAVDSAERMLRMVRENGASLETIARYEEQLSGAKQAYNDAVYNVAYMAGATTLAVIGSVAMCSPGLLLPTL